MDEANYAVWIHAYCKLIQIEEHNALLTLERDHCCIPCLGRMLYQTLRSELVSLYSRHADFEELLESPDFPDNLRQAKSRWETLRQGAARNLAAKTLVQVLTRHCSHPHYQDLAILLTHGTNVPVCLTGGEFPILRFSLLEYEFSADMLRMRAKRGNLTLTYALMFADASFSTILKQIRYLRSKFPW